MIVVYRVPPTMKSHTKRKIVPVNAKRTRNNRKWTTRLAIPTTAKIINSVSDKAAVMIVGNTREKDERAPWFNTNEFCGPIGKINATASTKPCQNANSIVLAASMIGICVRVWKEIRDDLS